MNIVFSRHACYQMLERNISQDEVISALSNPDKLFSQPERKFKAVKLIKKEGKEYLMVVVYRQIDSIKKVITAFLTTKLKKYLK